MIATSPEIEPYVAQFERLAEKAAGTEPSWLVSLRRHAINQFKDVGFPTTRHEEWKYTDVSPIARTAFRPPVELHSVEQHREAVERTLLFNSVKNRLVFVNGRYAAEFSRVQGLPSGARALSLAEAVQSEGHALEQHLGQRVSLDDRAFVALNTALWQDGAHIYVPRGVVVEDPIHVLYVTVDEGAPVSTHPRTLIVAEAHSQVTVIETYAGPKGQYFTNAVTEIVVDEGAVVDHYKLELEGQSAYHIASQHTAHERGANFTSHNISFGGLLVRNDITSHLGGEGIESTINGLYLTGSRQHVDNHTAIDHAMPHCNSHELYKGIMDGKSTAVFNGKIFVRQDAQKTDSKQTNQNLLLSKDATIDTKPQLEIYADDVRCTHGATVGQLDPDALFYLRARGIGVDEARDLLVHAFASDILERIKIDAVREELERMLYARLPQARVVE